MNNNENGRTTIIRTPHSPLPIPHSALRTWIRGEEGFTLLVAIMLLIALASAGLSTMDFTQLEWEVAANQSCVDKAYARAEACQQVALEGLSELKVPVFFLTNLDYDPKTGASDTLTIECLVRQSSFAGASASGAYPIGEITPDLFGTEYRYFGYLYKIEGFGGIGCGDNIYTQADFPEIPSGYTAPGMYVELEVGSAYGPCEKDKLSDCTALSR